MQISSYHYILFQATASHYVIEEDIRKAISDEHGEFCESNLSIGFTNN